MSGKLFAVLIVLTAGNIASLAAEPFSTNVKIEPGWIKGEVKNEILAFKGIPYAAPPKGAKRWRPPQPVEHWPPGPEVRDTTAFGSVCLQMVSIVPLLVYDQKGDDNCLFLNVWRPAERKSADERLPVLVWIHGGGYVIGGSNDPATGLSGVADGSELARQGLVVVSINYRLGRFGFFAHPALIEAQEDPPGYSGNFGLMDQTRALEWVQANIRQFGGDPSQVTVVGESAGGVSVMHLLISPKVKNLFHRIIVMSGGGRRAPLLRPMTGPADAPSAAKIDADFADKTLQIQGRGPEALAALRANADSDPSKFVQDVTFESVVEKALIDNTQSGTAMIDGKFVMGNPEDALCIGGAPKMPVIIGTVADDLPLFLPPKKSPNDPDYPYSYFPDINEARTIYGKELKDLGQDPKDSFNAMLEVGKDMTMHEPAHFVAKAMTAAGNFVWLYRFAYVATSDQVPDKPKVAWHSSELPFLFQTLDKSKAMPADQTMAGSFSGYLANFAKSSTLNANGLSPWPVFDPDPSKFQLMHFMVDGQTKPDTEQRGSVALVEKVVRCLPGASIQR